MKEEEPKISEKMSRYLFLQGLGELGASPPELYENHRYAYLRFKYMRAKMAVEEGLQFD